MLRKWQISPSLTHPILNVLESLQCHALPPLLPNSARLDIGPSGDKVLDMIYSHTLCTQQLWIYMHALPTTWACLCMHMLACMHTYQCASAHVHVLFPKPTLIYPSYFLFSHVGNSKKQMFSCLFSRSCFSSLISSSVSLFYFFSISLPFWFLIPAPILYLTLLFSHYTKAS